MPNIQLLNARPTATAATKLIALRITFLATGQKQPTHALRNGSSSGSDCGNVRRVLGLHPDDIVAGVDVVDLAGDSAGEVGQQVQPRAADVVDRHVAAK